MRRRLPLWPTVSGQPPRSRIRLHFERLSALRGRLLPSKVSQCSIPDLNVMTQSRCRPNTLLVSKGRRRGCSGLFALLLCLAAFAQASDSNHDDERVQSPPRETALISPTGGLAEIDLEVRRIQNLFEDLDRAPEWDRDAFRFRIDQRLRNLLDRINRFAFELAGQELTYEIRQSQRDQLIAYVDWTLEMALMRVRQIDQRISEARFDISEFEETTAGAIAEAFIQEQTRLRFAYAESLIDHLEARRRLALDPELAAQLQLPAEDIQSQVERTVERYAERLIGQIRLDAQTLAELRNRRAEDPLNSELERAQQAIRRKHSRSLTNLESIIGMMNRLNLDSTEQRSLLLQQRGLIGIELLERQVFFSILGDQFERAQRTVVRSGPNFLFRSLIFLVIVGVALLIARYVRKGVTALTEAVNFNRLAAAVLVPVSWVAVVVAGLILALSTLGVSVTPLLAGFGLAGILLGLALQDSLSNLASGAMILAYRPYDVDDHIQITGAAGKVKKMNLVATTINTFDNKVLIVPNKMIWSDTIINFTASRVRRVDVEVSFAYTEDLKKVERVLMDILDEHEMVLSSPQPNVHMGEMKDSAVTMMVKGWVRTEDYWPALWSLTREIKLRFDAEGISIPFPQRDVHLYTDGISTQVSGVRKKKTVSRRESAARSARPGSADRESKGNTD